MRFDRVLTMEISLDKEKLNIAVDHNNLGFGLNPWGILNRLWLRSSALCPLDDADMPLHSASMKLSGRPPLTLMVKCGGLCNLDISPEIKNLFKVAFGYIRRVHPEIPDEPTGRLVLHYFGNGLEKAVFTTR